MRAALSVVQAAAEPPPAKTETVGEQIRRLQAEARQLAKDHVRAMSAAMLETGLMAAEIAQGGEVYPPGIRELAERLVNETEARVQTLEALISRTL
jgi:hypothetical protein